MRYSLIALIMLSTLILSYGQSITSRSVEIKAYEKFQKMALKNRPPGIQEQPYKEIEGSPFYYDQIWEADLILNNGIAIHNIPIQIDLYADEIIGAKEDSSKVYLDLDHYKEIVVHHIDHIDIFRKNHPEHPRKFYQNLYFGENIILLKSIEVEHVEMSMINGGVREFVNKFNKNTYYSLVRNNKVEKIYLKKKRFFKKFAKNEIRLMKAYAKENDLKLNQENDFVALITFLDNQVLNK